MKQRAKELATFFICIGVIGLLLGIVNPAVTAFESALGYNTSGEVQL